MIGQNIVKPRPQNASPVIKIMACVKVGNDLWMMIGDISCELSKFPANEFPVLLIFSRRENNIHPINKQKSLDWFS